VIRLVADGLKNREIAQRLKVKEHSIRNYIYRIFEKLGAAGRVELILIMCLVTGIVAIRLACTQSAESRTEFILAPSLHPLCE